MNNRNEIAAFAAAMGTLDSLASSVAGLGGFLVYVGEYNHGITLIVIAAVVMIIRQLLKQIDRFTACKK